MIPTQPHAFLRIALVEDDRAQAERTIEALVAVGHKVDWYTGVLCFMAEVRNSKPDLFLLDWALPDGEGVTLVGWIQRSMGRHAPIVIFSRFDEDERIVEALAAGADDYIIKPVAAPVLLARIAALLRRSRPPAEQPLVIEDGAYRLDAAKRALCVAGAPTELQPKEFDLAWYLFQHRDRLIRRDELTAAVWGRETPGSARTLDTHLYTLRRKLKFAEYGFRLSNVYREGYRLERGVPFGDLLA